MTDHSAAPFVGEALLALIANYAAGTFLLGAES